MNGFALLDDCAATAAKPTSRLYTGLVRECRCEDPKRLEAVWIEAEREMRAGRHAVVLADYEWGTRLLGVGDEGWGAEEEGALRLLLFADLRRLSSQEVDRWLAEREAKALADGRHGQAGASPGVERGYPEQREGEKDEPSKLGQGEEEDGDGESNAVGAGVHPAGSAPASALGSTFTATTTSATTSNTTHTSALASISTSAPPPAPAGVFNVRPSLDTVAFKAALDRIHDLLLAGETYQVNFTYRLDLQTFGSPFSLYRRLRANQPVPFGAFLCLPPSRAPSKGNGSATNSASISGTGAGTSPSPSPHLSPHLSPRPNPSPVPGPNPNIGLGPGTGTVIGAGPSTDPGTCTGEPTWILSCSPELFLRHQGGRLQARPMKGTAPRGADAATDAALAHQLGDNAKTRAENLMIVDLLRNDVGRLARTGSVRVPALFQVEAHPSLWQMTSTIEADLPSSVTFAQILRATFPCGSITGAPKHRTMHWIRQLETRPRGLYTGAIGWIDLPAGEGMATGGEGKGRQVSLGRAHHLPASATGEVPAGGTGDEPGRETHEFVAGRLAEGPLGGADRGADEPTPACGDFCLSVAIRTLTLGTPALGAPALGDSPLAPRPGILGIGAGIVHDSQAEEEYAECQLKARFLTGLDPGFSLLETLCASRADGIRYLDRHLERLCRSAEGLGFRLPLAEMLSALEAKVAALPPGHP